MIIIQNRDKCILMLCYEQQFMTTKQLIRFFFSKVHPSEAYRRLKELEKSGFIKRQPSITQGTGDYIRVTRDGADIAQGIASAQVPQLPRLNLHRIPHDIAVNEVRMRIHDLWPSAVWISELGLRDKFGQENFSYPLPSCPDGMMEFQDGRTCAIEVECSTKERERYETNFRRWAKRGGADFVLYVVNNKHTEAAVQRVMQVTDSFVGGTISYDSLLSSESPLVWTPSGEVSLFKLYPGRTS